jgi:hypothetical protein
MLKTEHSNRQKKPKSTKENMKIPVRMKTEKEIGGLYHVATDDCNDSDDEDDEDDYEKGVALLSRSLIYYDAVYSATCLRTFRRK